MLTLVVGNGTGPGEGGEDALRETVSCDDKLPLGGVHEGGGGEIVQKVLVAAGVDHAHKTELAGITPEKRRIRPVA
ncbi:unnamed protein product [Dibothriocephalus latus]|uniref:Uncharacterized protein n=1 Tax=Dibothriocephalus latus TaxID=60516 RepID=A0A3P6RS54_DIBLA|nr:unnamed protein product [Dibothriocephalus latus]